MKFRRMIPDELINDVPMSVAEISLHNYLPALNGASLGYLKNGVVTNGEELRHVRHRKVTRVCA
ncbi:MAG: hypothetical protein ABL983_03545, partial [Nitrospira sp.]